MSRRRTYTKDVCVDVTVDLADWTDEEIIAEAKARGCVEVISDLDESATPIVHRLYEAYRAGNVRAVDTELRNLFDAALGRLVGDSPLKQAA